LETGIVRIKILAREKEDENWAFEAFLKGTEISDEEMDRIVHDLYKEISDMIDCSQCGNCCKEMSPLLDDEDIHRLSEIVGVPLDQVKRQYLVNDEVEHGKFVFRQKPCPFLKDNRCSVWQNRPKDCVSYPHLDKEGFVFRLIAVVQSCSVCPIVFNVYERLKLLLWNVRVR
jgi:Fe-S-cluster containining protein